ncbi:MAG TPA: molybdopterin-dependent oxidoreductase [Chloroflexota bacterium]|nr:molybdopterin-dependent oxidoreductase [Chloroflexota bacterium]
MRGFWIGFAAGGVFLVVELLGRTAAGVPTLAELVQDRLILLLPGPVFSFFLDRLFYLGKPLLFATLLVGQLVLAGLGGVVLARWPKPYILAGALWLVTGLLVLPLAGQGIFAGNLGVALASFLAFAAYGATVSYYQHEFALDAPDVGHPQRSGPIETSAGRRLLLGGGISVLVSAILGRMVIGTLPSLPAAGAGNGNSADETTPHWPSPVTPVAQFYEVSKNLVDPTVDLSTWRLTVTGMVASTLVLTYEDIRAMPAHETIRTLECISNDVGGNLMSNGRWTGVRMSDVLQKAGVKAGATDLYFSSVDGYSENMPLAIAMDPNTLLVYLIDGQQLPQKHGFPLRVLNTGTFGMKNPKWLTGIQLTTTAPVGYWEGQGWSNQSIVQTMSRIDFPSDGAVVRMSDVLVGGVAFAGSRGIKQVEFSTDNGSTWLAAMLQPSLGLQTWTFWSAHWQPARPGRYGLAVRATDGTGQVQTDRRATPFPNGATGYDRISLQVIN